MMERFLSGVPWLPRSKYHVAVHEPTPRGTFVRVSFRKGACPCGGLQGRYAAASRWVKPDESVDDFLHDISSWVSATHGSCGCNALILCEPVAAPATTTTAAAVAGEVRMDVDAQGAAPPAAADAPMLADPVVARDSTHTLSSAEMGTSGSPPKATGTGGDAAAAARARAFQTPARRRDDDGDATMDDARAGDGTLNSTGPGTREWASAWGG